MKYDTNEFSHRTNAGNSLQWRKLTKLFFFFLYLQVNIATPVFAPQNTIDETYFDGGSQFKLSKTSQNLEGDFKIQLLHERFHFGEAANETVTENINQLT